MKSNSKAKLILPANDTASSRRLISSAAMAIITMLAMATVSPAQDTPAKAEPTTVSEASRTLLAAFYEAADHGDLAGMKAKMAELQASDPQCDRLPTLSLKVAMAGKDWSGVKKALESMPPGSLRDTSMQNVIQGIVMDQWQGAPKDLLDAAVKAADEMIQHKDEPATSGDHLLLSMVHWKAEDKKGAVEHARTAMKVAEEGKEPAAFRAALERFVKQVEAGTMPSIMEFSAWASGETPGAVAEPELPDQGFDVAAHVGKPVEIKFTAADGREVDLAKLKGKVVLVDFWATWCGPCVAELPHVKTAYQKYHDKGFEIIGISFEGEGGKEKLLKFAQDRELPWPQYFDGKGWNNAFGRRFSIKGIPAMWLFDKEGKLADPNAREDLAAKVEKLLGN